MKYLPFTKAREFVQKLGLRSEKEWKIYKNSGRKPPNIPSYPQSVYKANWESMGDWLGTGFVANYKRNYRPFTSARAVAHSLKLDTGKEWIDYCKSGKLPDEIPKTPWHIYKEDWKDMGDWLGTGNLAPKNRIFKPFTEAREYVHSLKLRSYEGWRKFCKSKEKPYDIPTNPNKTYPNEWNGIGDWLGTGSIASFNKKFRPFNQARSFVRSLGLRNYGEWRQYRKSNRKPYDIPSNPGDSYGIQFKGYGDWLGTGYVAPRNRSYQSFEDARKFVRCLTLKSQKDWKAYCHSGKKPENIPSNPLRKYKKEWKGMGDWLGTGYIATYKRDYRPFNQAREFVRKLNLKSSQDWKTYCKSGKKPVDIPSSPIRSYKKKWKGMGDWLGTGYVPPKDRKYRSFKEAKQYVRRLKLANGKEWRKYCNSGTKPKDIPNYPEYSYKKEWHGIGDWLGTGYVALKDRIYWPFQRAREFVHTLKLNNRREWKEYYNSGKKPIVIPSNPAKVYINDWKGMGDWLGTGYVAVTSRVYRPFNNAKDFVHELGLTDFNDWKHYCKSKEKPADIPNYPNVVYESEWIDWFVWLGTTGMTWDVEAVKDLLRDLISSKVLFDWDEAVLYSFLLRKGVLNLAESNRHKNFFKNLIKASRTEEGRIKIEEYVNSDSKTPPDFYALSIEKGEEIAPASPSELYNVAGAGDPLDYDNRVTVDQVLEHTNVLESISVDQEAMQFYLNFSVDELWKLAFKNEVDTVNKVRTIGKNGNRYHDTVISTFLSDYDASRAIIPPTGYSFPFPPTLMQLQVAHRVEIQPYFGNFSGTGAGKTLSAILASRIVRSKMSVIVCPNDVVDQWKRSIVEVFPNSKVTTGKASFYAAYSEDHYQYLVLNYDKFSQEDSPNLILNLGKQKIDLVVLDEIHFTKIRDEEEISKRRKNLDGLMTLVRKKNPNVKVLGLSATPVVNNLREGKSLLELLSGKIYDDISTKSTIPNAVTLYEKLSTLSIRELPKYSVDTDTHVIDVVAPPPPLLSVKQLKSNPLAIEKFLTDARIPEIVKLIEDQCIIYTEYVEDIIKKISEAISHAGYTFALYTGYDKSGLARFLDKKVQVLIASRPLSVGVDGLQHICNRLIINTLPWTNAQYQQLLGRLVRKGQIRDVVHVYLIKASIGGYQYDELKWKRIQFKRTLADCAVDGILPEKNLVTPQQAAMEAVKWLERLERGEISTVVRRDLNVELAPVEIKKRIAKFGDFAKLNNRINNENSGTTHTRMVTDPKEWDEYHRQYREARKDWEVVPFLEVIKRIKQLSPRLMVGDFGCGEAQIMEEFGENRVYSFDHVAVNNKVKACDMKSTGLPDEAIDIAVFSLSLMGRNWESYILEAKRCLATGGYLLVADTTKSIDKRLSKIREAIKKQGFEIYSEEQKGDFTFIEAREL